MGEFEEELKEFAKEIGLGEESKDVSDSPYALLIEDIDRKEDQELIYQVLSQSGLDLDLESIRKQLEEGHLLISHLNEARAALITDKIKNIEADIRFGLLDDLRSKQKKKESVEKTPSGSAQPLFSQAKGEVILTTAPTIPEKSVRKYLGIVSTEITMPEEVVLEELGKEIEEGCTASLIRSEYDVLVSQVLKALEAKAKKMKATAVIAISFDFKFLSEKKSFVIFATGTAVEI